MTPLLLLLLTLTAGADPAADIGRVATSLATPAAVGSRWSDLSPGADGKLYLTWVQVDGAASSLHFARWQGERWGPARLIARGEDWFVNWADFPSMTALADGTLFAHYLPKVADATYAYHVAVVRSGDGGVTWGAPLRLHRDASATEHGFVSMVPWRERVGIFWLDGSAMKGGHGSHGDEAGDMSLRFTTLDAAGQRGAEVVVDDRVCECCQTAAVASADSALVVYRDRSADEVRDIGLGRVRIEALTEDPAAGSTSRPGAGASAGNPAPSPAPSPAAMIVHADGWRIEGCPVNGPAIAARGSQVAVAWFSAGADQQPRVQVAFSVDAGVNFAEPLRVDAGNPVGRVDTLFVDSDAVVVVWQEIHEQAAEVRVRKIYRDGRRGPSRIATTTVKSRGAGFPRLGQLGAELFLTWTDAGPPFQVRTARLHVRGQR